MTPNFNKSRLNELITIKTTFSTCKLRVLSVHTFLMCYTFKFYLCLYSIVFSSSGILIICKLNFFHPSSISTTFFSDFFLIFISFSFSWLLFCFSLMPFVIFSFQTIPHWACHNWDLRSNSDFWTSLSSVVHYYSCLPFSLLVSTLRF